MSAHTDYLLARIGQITVNAERTVAQLIEQIEAKDAEIARLKTDLEKGLSPQTGGDV